jgi:hypothetical protein
MGITGVAQLAADKTPDFRGKRELSPVISLWRTYKESQHALV